MDANSYLRLENKEEPSKPLLKKATELLILWLIIPAFSIGFGIIFVNEAPNCFWSRFLECFLIGFAILFILNLFLSTVSQIQSQNELQIQVHDRTNENGHLEPQENRNKIKLFNIILFLASPFGIPLLILVCWQVPDVTEQCPKPSTFSVLLYELFLTLSFGYCLFLDSTSYFSIENYYPKCFKMNSFGVISELLDTLPQLFWYTSWFPFFAILCAFIVSCCLLINDWADMDDNINYQGLDIAQFLGDVVALCGYFQLCLRRENVKTLKKLEPLIKALEAHGDQKFKLNKIRITDWFGYFLLVRTNFIHLSFQLDRLSLYEAIYQVYWGFLSAIMLSTAANWIQQLANILSLFEESFRIRVDNILKGKELLRSQERKGVFMDSDEAKRLRDAEIRGLAIDWAGLMNHVLEASREFQTYWGAVLLAVAFTAPLEAIIIGFYLQDTSTSINVAGFLISDVGFIFTVAMILWECCQVSYRIRFVGSKICLAHHMEGIRLQAFPVPGLEVFGQPLNHTFLGAYVITWAVSVYATLKQSSNNR